MRSDRRIRISILTMMGIVALAAVLLSWGVAAEKARRVAALTTELTRAEDRLSWAERIHNRGYVSKASLVSERLNVQHVQLQLKELGAPPKRP
jgi:hypothetical protein